MHLLIIVNYAVLVLVQNESHGHTAALCNHNLKHIVKWNIMLLIKLMCIPPSLSSHNVCWATLGQLFIFDLIDTTSITSSVYLVLVAYIYVLLPSAVRCINTIFSHSIYCITPF